MRAFSDLSGDSAIARVRAHLGLLTGFVRHFRRNAQATRRAQRRRMSLALAEDCERQGSERRKLAGEIERASLKEMRQ